MIRTSVHVRRRLMEETERVLLQLDPHQGVGLRELLRAFREGNGVLLREHDLQALIQRRRDGNGDGHRISADDLVDVLDQWEAMG